MASLRKDNPALWAEFTAHIRDVVGDWTDDQIAAVELWQMPELPIEIEIIDGKVYHRISPDVDVEIVQ